MHALILGLRYDDHMIIYYLLCILCIVNNKRTKVQAALGCKGAGAQCSRGQVVNSRHSNNNLNKQEHHSITASRLSPAHTKTQRAHALWVTQWHYSRICRWHPRWSCWDHYSVCIVIVAAVARECMMLFGFYFCVVTRMTTTITYYYVQYNVYVWQKYSNTVHVLQHHDSDAYNHCPCQWKSLNRNHKSQGRVTCS